jgi:hypothetical protein
MARKSEKCPRQKVSFATITPHQSNTMEQNNNNNNIVANNNNNNVANPVQANRERRNRMQCGFCSLGCLLVGAIALLIAGAYYYSIYDRHDGIDYKRMYLSLSRQQYFSGTVILIY